jgi:hypothetical protein
MDDNRNTNIQERHARRQAVRQERRQKRQERRQKRQARQTLVLRIVGGYKCATTTLAKTFGTRKTHYLYDDMNDSVTTILFPFRDNAEVFPSALFQNIIDAEYSYSLCGPNGMFKKQDYTTMKKLVLQIPAIVLFAFFKYKLPLLEKAVHLNNIARIKSFNETYGCSIDYLNPDIQTFDIVVNGIPRKLIAFDSSFLNSNFEKLKEIMFSTPRPDIPLKVNNVSTQKWYAPKYNEFMTIFKSKMIAKSREDQLKDGTTYV